MSVAVPEEDADNVCASLTATSVAVPDEDAVMLTIRTAPTVTVAVPDEDAVITIVNLAPMAK